MVEPFGDPNLRAVVAQRAIELGSDHVGTNESKRKATYGKDKAVVKGKGDQQQRKW
mgnify:CR=1 FL=1